MSREGAAAPNSSRRSLMRLCVLNLAVLLLAWGLGSALADRLWWATLLVYVPQHLFGLPALALLIVSLARRDGWAIGLNALAFLAFAVLLLGFEVPAASSAQAGRTVRVMIWNIAGGRFADAAALARVVRAVNPDVLCLQESRGLETGSLKPFGHDLRAHLPGYRLVAE